MLGEQLVQGHAVAEAREGDEEESMVTTGLDFLKPYKSAANSWCRDAKASEFAVSRYQLGTMLVSA